MRIHQVVTVIHNTLLCLDFGQIGHAFYPCSFTVLDAPNMEFLFGLDMLRKHQVIA